MKLRVGQEIDIQADKRYIEHVRDHAMTDVYDSLVELITNADDSYSRLYRDKKRSKDGGDILIEHCERRRGNRSFLIIRDKAEGMSSGKMRDSLAKMGVYLSKEGDRGYMGRGAKDCTALGDLTYESIKDNRYYKCRITHNLKFILDDDGKRVTKEHRKKLELKKGNGTSVKLELLPEKPIPKIRSLIENLPWHYALRDIFSGTSDSCVKLRRAERGKSKVEKLLYHPPDGEVVVHDKFDIPGYEGSRAHLIIFRSPERLPESKNRFERFGILIKGERAIHECTLFSDEFKKDPHAHQYFGRLECTYIDKMMLEYENRRKAGLPHPPENPRLVVDPNRRFGLDRTHPFVAALFQIPSEHLRALIAKDREREKSRSREVANQETRSRLNRLAKLAGKFLREQLDDLEELSVGDAFEEKAFSKKGVFIYPTYLNLFVGSERTLTIYVKRDLIKKEGASVNIEADPEGVIEIYGSPVKLHPHRKKEDRLLGSFKIRGLKPDEDVILTAACEGLPETQALVHVKEKGVDEHIFGLPLEFERPDYKVYQGRRKKIRLFGKYPEVVAKETEVKVYSDDQSKAAVRGRCLLTPVSGSNYAVGDVVIEGRKLKSKTTIIAEIHGREAETAITVIDKRDRDPAIPIKFELRDEDYGNFRARWAEAEGQPHLLLISAKHKSVARYLGSAEDEFPGQDTPWFRVLLAEIVAESVCRKALTLEAKNHPYDFPWADFKRPDVIAEDVFSQMQQRLRDFVAAAHSVMIRDSEIKAAQASN